MKLIFLNRFFYPDHSATSQILSDLAFALAERGHEVQSSLRGSADDGSRKLEEPRDRSGHQHYPESRPPPSAVAISLAGRLTMALFSCPQALR